jgi:hypothetical protein
MPDRLAELLVPPEPIYRPSKAARANVAGLLRTVAETPKGNRNNALFWASCRTCEDGILDEIQDQLIAAAISTGVTEDSARRTIASARRTNA